MDRQYKAADTVRVYQSSKDGKLLATVQRVPYTAAGFDSYKYKDVLYKGFAYWNTSEYPSKKVVYILLDEPFFKA